MRKSALDTDIFSEVVKGKNVVVRERAAAYIAACGPLTISLVTVLEIVKGLHKGAARGGTGWGRDGDGAKERNKRAGFPSSFASRIAEPEPPGLR